ncbi:zinc finger C2HC domain-containing protein 1C isoform X5 [Cloeon dipterum]|uniref:zinc finger C2HC domain-containing protein 1C isoform X5 n=2 Tax=Cloeon dipterum TaxID=197152 RepID=UPI00321FF3C9
MAGWKRVLDSLSEHGGRRSDPGMAEVVSMALGMSWAAKSWDEASSRNYVHLARFQQRQLIEKEQKLLQMLEDQQQRTIQRVSGRGSAGSNTSSGSGSSTNSTGRVRQLLEERRSMQSLSSSVSSMSSSRSQLSESKSMPTGWDRSYPLDPLKPKTNTTRAPVKPTTQRSSTLQAPVSMRPTTRTNRGPLQDSSNGSSPFGRLSNVGARNGLANDAENSLSQPVVSKKPLVKALAEPKIKVAPLKREPVAPRPRPAPAAVSPVTSPTKSVSPPYSTDYKAPKPKSSPSSGAGSAAPPVKHTEPCPPGMAECGMCGRRFAEDRIGKHEDVCRKTKQKKRKAFDPVKMRTQGTEAESFVKSAGRRGAEPVKRQQQQQQQQKQQQSTSKGNWRKKHEEFIETIRQARMVKQIMDAGGKLSDLPPPKPMDTSDYIQCPHCSRRFSEGAAERHIPRCANIKSNKQAPKGRK